MAERDVRKYGPAYPIEGTENLAISDISLWRLAVDILEGTVDKILAPNAISIAAPKRGAPVVYDMTTAAMPYFGILQAKVRRTR